MKANNDTKVITRYINRNGFYYRLDIYCVGWKGTTHPINKVHSIQNNDLFRNSFTIFLTNFLKDVGNYDRIIMNVNQITKVVNTKVLVKDGIK